MACIDIPDHGITEKRGRLFYAYDGERMSYAHLSAGGAVLCVEHLPGNEPSLGVYTVPSVQKWYDKLSESFFGLYDGDVRRELRERAEDLGVTLTPEKAALLADETYE